jgi:hypothetical protein
MIAFSWTCPYCNRDTTITESNYSEDTHFFNLNSKDGNLGIKTIVISCPNENCREYSISTKLYAASYASMSGLYTTGDPFLHWTLKPISDAKQFPEYVPKVIIVDYEEACLIT